MKRNSRRPRLKVTADGKAVISHAGARLLSELADAAGLTDGLSAAMAATKQRRRGHDRGDVLVDMAVMIADGGDAISDLAVLRDQPELFGEVASTPTAWRVLEAVDAAALARIAGARAQARAQVWAAGGDPGFYVMDFDGTLITAHSDKEHAAPTYKRGFGFHPLLAFLDATGEALAGILRPGNAGSNTAADHVALLGMALAQLPVDPEQVEVVARADSAALTHDFIDACRAASVRFSVGHDLTEPIRNACLCVPERSHAGHRPPRRPPPRRPAQLHRRRRPPLPGLHHRSRRHRRRLPRGAPARPGPSREAHLRRQGHRPGQPALGRLRHQLCVDDPRTRRARPVGLDAPGLPRR